MCMIIGVNGSRTTDREAERGQKGFASRAQGIHIYFGYRDMKRFVVSW